MRFKEWREVKLGEIIEFNPKESIPKGTLAKKISMDMIEPFYKYVNEYEIEEYKGGSKFRNGDTLMARITPCLENGKTIKVTKLGKDEIGFGSTEFIVLRAKEGLTTEDYVYYTAISPNVRDIAIKSMTGTSGRQRAQVNVIENIQINLPPLNEQKAIAKILSDLDEKIEINNRINKVLEEMAQAIFKRWFVDFEFPNENGEPYKSSGGEMVESELGPIPKGWEVKTLEEITSKFTTGLNPRRNFVLGRGNNYYVTIKNMGNQTIILDDRCDKIDDEAIQKINKRSDLRKGDILFSAIGTIGRTYLIDETPRNWNISESIFTLRASNEKLIEFLYLLMLSVELQAYSKLLASGSVQKGIRMSDLKKYKFAISFDLAINDFRNTILPIIKQYKRNQNENKILTQLRDTLLPKLMSGEIRVPLD